MERSRKIFLEISSAAHKVNTTANKYADHKGLPGVQRSHFQLEADMQRISLACNTLASILANLSSRPDDPAFDVRLQDWLSSDEPGVCLDTLSRMERLLRKDTSLWKTMVTFARRGAAPVQDKIKEAVDLFGSYKGCFHFLFTTETWNNEGGVLQEKDAPQSQEHVTKGSDVLDQSLPVADLTTTNTAISDTTMYQREQKNRRTIVMKLKGKDARNLKEILEWLDGLNCAEKQDVTLLLRQPDTCKWLFDTMQYKMWRNGEYASLWLRGKPGAGKSVLASSVIDSLEKIRREGVILAFFYCDFRNERSTSASEALRSILSQLLYQLRESALDPKSLIDDLVEAKRRGGAARNNTKELAEFASRTARLFMKKPLVVVDALDECRDVETLLEGLNAMEAYVQLFMTSRPLPVIKDGLSTTRFVSMDDMRENLSADIALHVTRELDARRRLRVLRPEVKEEIYTVLCQKADGMFRWVQCSIDTLSRCVTLKELSAALNNLPEGLDETYKRILLAIDTETREGQLALRALVWLVAALRPLHIDELMEGLSIDLEKRTTDLSIGPMHRVALLDACGSLVTYNEATNAIILSHFSVKEYLTSEFARTQLPRYYIDWERAHLQLTRSCMCYISAFLKRPGSSGSSYSDASFDRKVHLMSHPLLDYVLEDALDHFRYIGPQIKSVPPDIKALAKDVEQHSELWDDTCLGTMRIADFTTPSWPVSIHDLPLYILVAFAPDSLLREYLRPIFKPKEGTSPLVYAAYFNKRAHAWTLLSRGVKLNHRGWETDGSCRALPIEVALRNGHYSMATFFIEEGSIISPQIFTQLLLEHHYWNIPSSIKRMLLQTDDFAEAANDILAQGPLDYFQGYSVEGIHGKDLVCIVRRMIQVHSSIPQYFNCLLNIAMEYFREDDALETMKLLVGYGCDPLEANPSGKPYLCIAVERAHVSAAQYLISLGAQPPRDMLLIAWKLWYSELTAPIGVRAPMIRFLVENGADVHVRTDAGDSMLHAALQSFQEEDALWTIEALVGYGCDPLEPNSSGKSCIHIAIEQGYIAVAQYLLSLDIPLPPDILVTLDPLGTWKTAQTIRFLVENGADVHACTENGDSVFHVALDFSQDEEETFDIAELLVGYGCDPLGANLSGKIPLHVAIEQAQTSVVGYIVSLGIPLPPDLLLVALNSQQSAATRMSIVHLLIYSGADVHVYAETGDSVLHIVLESFSEECALGTAELLIRGGCTPLAVNSSGKTPLDIALEQAHISVAKYLLSLGVPLPPDIFVILSPHGRWKTVQIISFLIEYGADVHARNEVGDSVLHVILESLDSLHEAREVVELLVVYGCDPFEANSTGKTPLRIAVERGLYFVESYLRSLGAHDEV